MIEEEKGESWVIWLEKCKNRQYGWMVKLPLNLER